MPRPFTRLAEPFAFVRQFTPSWFAMTMGTGALALVVAALPWGGAIEAQLAEGLWLFNAVLFGGFALLFLARVLLFRDTVRPMLLHPVQSMFLGAIPMGLATLINGLVLFGAPHWGSQVIALAHGLWWLDVVLALGAALLVPYLMFTRQDHALEKLTAVWLLPIVAPEVAAAAAGVLAPHLAPEAARQMLVVGYLLWGVSLSLAFSLITLVLLRLALHKLPGSEFAATSWLPVGPLATGCLGLLSLGKAMPAAFADTPLAGVAELARDLGLLGSLLLWGAALWWLVMALFCTRRHLRQDMRFNLGWWGFTFPLAVFTLATFELQRRTGMDFFGPIGAALALGLALIWLQVMARTLAGLWHGELFQAPCLAAAGGLSRN
ncbi:TDT family transporter [Pseudomonas sp. JS3066]|jgi:C4-dicarboxylate transporter/malic acid transport protein|uniref:TDT family transporter n=1 Tax=unclassified Pseudomonas TaxID=196821 RepID=UPI000EA95263|nr:MULTISPECIES: TDT family transporter [unclassified Pseudomonas]AYF89006.1 C4-dicarboxylate ABC transporter [Pseudomonas sp. DY-1]MDH4653201.1 C4-dicarboxylate ABC transporter [Pseudomonas sp. BN606]MRK21077.1 C4-dicarboxylate ABC transporter [Pseudomonas sp. JG-B]WVK93455.1 TDT family transporter [Pseudomonas sp. JS3066]